jgi:nucleoside-diphosphate-sugar epimerase
LKYDLSAYRCDLLDKAKLERIVKAIRPEGIIHTAAYGAYPDKQKDVQKMYDVNLQGTMNLINAYQGYEVFINTGSSSEYGRCDTPMRENQAARPESHYAASKLAATAFCQAHVKKTGNPIINTRLFSVYGPYEESTRLIPSVIDKCLTNQNIKLTSGTQKRDFVNIKDVEDAYVMLLKRPDLSGNIFNIGTGIQHQVKDVVELIIKNTDSKSVPLFGEREMRKDEAMEWVSDISSSRDAFGFKPKVSIEKGIESEINWFKDYNEVRGE